MNSLDIFPVETTGSRRKEGVWLCSDALIQDRGVVLGGVLEPLGSRTLSDQPIQENPSKIVADGGV